MDTVTGTRKSAGMHCRNHEDVTVDSGFEGWGLGRRVWSSSAWRLAEIEFRRLTLRLLDIEPRREHEHLNAAQSSSDSFVEL